MPDQLNALSEAVASFESPEDANPRGFKKRRSSFWKSIPKQAAENLFILSSVVPRVRHQGVWNACTSMALSGMIEARSKVATGNDVSLVAGFIHNCLAGRNQPVQPLDAQFAVGLCKDAGVLQGFSDEMPVAPSICQSMGVRTRIADFRFVASLDDVVRGLTTSGPLLADLYVPRATFFSHQGSQTLEFPANPEQPLLHSMLLIGLDFRDGRQLALVQNSGGLGWGANGQAWIRIGSGGLLSDRQPLEIRV
jgi:hypothetical protein